MIKRKDLIDVLDEPSSYGVESSINSSDAIEMVSHGSEFIIKLTTPIGVRYVGKTKFVGRHSDSLLLLELPDISDEDLKFFFQEGFRVDIKAISSKGEGSLIRFRSQVKHILKSPLPLLLISIPGIMKINQLREEVRYDVNLTAQVVTQSLKLECQVRDISKGGCRFITSPLAKHLEIGDRISISIVKPKKSKIELMPFAGIVCNLQRSTHHAKYGLKFDDSNLVRIKNMLESMKFDVAKLELKF